MRSPGWTTYSVQSVNLSAWRLVWMATLLFAPPTCACSQSRGMGKKSRTKKVVGPDADLSTKSRGKSPPEISTATSSFTVWFRCEPIKYSLAGADFNLNQTVSTENLTCGTCRGTAGSAHIAGKQITTTINHSVSLVACLQHVGNPPKPSDCLFQGGVHEISVQLWIENSRRTNTKPV